MKRALSRYRDILLPVLLFLILGTIPIGIRSLIEQRENVAIEDLTHQFGRNIAGEIQGVIDARIGILRVVAARRSDPGFTEAIFDRVASLYEREFPGVLFLNWIDQNFILRWVYPRTEASRKFVGHDSRTFPTARYVLEATRTLQPTASAAVDLMVGGQGFILTFPIVNDGHYLGRVTGVLRVSDLMALALTGHPSQEFEVRVRDGDVEMFSRNWTGTVSRFHDVQHVRVLNRRWDIEVQPATGYVEALKPITKNVVLVGGLFLAAALALLLYAQLRNRLRSTELRQTQQRLYDAVEALPAAILLYDRNHRLVLWNSFAKTLYGTVYEHFRAGMPYSEVARLMADAFVPGTAEEKEAYAASWIERFETHPGKGEAQLIDGRFFQYADWRTADGATVCLSTDITENKNQEAALHRAQELLREAIEGLPAGFLLWDAHEKLVLWNRYATIVHPSIAARLRVGMPYGEFADAVSHTVDVSGDQDLLNMRSDLIETFRSAPNTSELTLKNGATLQLIDWRTTDLSTVSLHFDISETKRREQELRQVQRMDALGKLTGGIAHDFNNLLQVILGCTDLMLAHTRNGDEISQLAAQVRGAAVRGAELTSRLLSYSRKQALRPEPVDLNRLVMRSSEMLRRTLGEHIQIETVLAGGLWPAVADAAQLESALLNLAVNARDAMPEGGKLTIETANVRLDDSYADGNPGIKPGQYTMVAVTDTGHGMSPETIEHAFEPFFTTKSPGRGTGLGLSMVYGFVKQSEGHIKIYSELGQGTSVKVYLPRAEAGSQAETPTKQIPPSIPSGSETVLVVEDDDLVRNVVVQQLRGLGYEVRAASDAAAALALLEGSAPIDLLFTDIVMPGGIMGTELAKRALHLRPTLRILFTSGYTANAVAHQGVLDRGIHLLQKPYPSDQLAHKIRAVLDAPPSSTPLSA